MVWSYPRGGNLSKEGETALDVVAYSAQIACQLGAHVIKVKAPGNVFEKQESFYKNIPSQNLSERVSHIIQSAFNGRRIVIFSGGAKKGTTELLREIELLAQGGAFGSIVGP